jgi:hypothetical protein
MQQLVEQEAAIKSMQASTAEAVAELREKLTEQQQAAQQLEASLQVWAMCCIQLAAYCTLANCERILPSSAADDNTRTVIAGSAQPAVP